MPIYSSDKNPITLIREKPFKLERDIQSFFEENLGTIMSLQLVKSEFSIKNKRIDSLAFYIRSKALIIIEYKREKNISVVDQGYAYLSLKIPSRR